MRHDKHIYELDGEAFSTLEEFATHFSDRVLSDYVWNENLDAFNDILRGGFGTPERGFVLRWRNSSLSRERLGYPETKRKLEQMYANCHPTNRESIAQQILDASNCKGSTLFDWLVEIIEDHCEGGTQSEDGVELWLE